MHLTGDNGWNRYTTTISLTLIEAWQMNCVWRIPSTTTNRKMRCIFYIHASITQFATWQKILFNKIKDQPFPGRNLDKMSAHGTANTHARTNTATNNTLSQILTILSCFTLLDPLVHFRPNVTWKLWESLLNNKCRKDLKLMRPAVYVIPWGMGP